MDADAAMTALGLVLTDAEFGPQHGPAGVRNGLRDTYINGALFRREYLRGCLCGFTTGWFATIAEADTAIGRHLDWIATEYDTSETRVWGTYGNGNRATTIDYAPPTGGVRRPRNPNRSTTDHRQKR